jgi:3-hydroxymyristoyl/3-hydroxydecanoyl-(acyl carrier protein) dehydratase
MQDTVLFELKDLLEILPHREPFLFVDRVVRLEPHKEIVAERDLRQEEPQFAGHFPGRPIMPGVLVAEALAQTSGLLMGLSDRATSADQPARPRMFFLAATNLKFTHPATPGDRLQLKAVADKGFGGLFRFQVEALSGRHLVASGSLTLAAVEAEV